MKIYLATDHSGIDLKNAIKKHLLEMKYEVEDCGAIEFNPNDDYPDSSAAAAEKVSKNLDAKGIIFGGSGQGEAMTANKFPGVRCALFYGPMVAKREVDITGKQSTDPYELMRLTRQHNDANMLSISTRFTSEEEAIHAVDVFLETPFSEDARHVRRIEKMIAIEKELSSRA